MTANAVNEDRPMVGTDAPARGGRRIVVGVDGSPNAERALAWAIDEVRRAGGSVTAVHAWTMGPYQPSIYSASTLGPDVWRKCAKAVLDRACDAVDATGVDVHRVLREGMPTAVLLDEGERADLVVVGARGHSGLTGLLLGTVGDQLAHHAPCPVVIVPEAAAA